MSTLLRRRRLLIAQAAGGGGGGGNTGYRGGALLSYASGNFTGTVPAGVQAGDVMYAAFLQDAGSTTAGSTGFAADTGSPQTTTTNGFPCTLLKKIATGSEGGTTLTFPSGATVGQGALIVISGANATQPDATTTNGKGTASTIAVPAITTGTNNAMHIIFIFNFNALPGTPAGYTARQASAAWVATFTKVIASAGAVSGVTASGGGDWVAFSAAVRSS